MQVKLRWVITAHQAGWLTLKKKHPALAGVAQWIGCRSASQGVTGSVPGWGTCLGCRPHPQWGVREGQPHIDISLLFLPPFFFLEIHKILKRERKKQELAKMWKNWNPVHFWWECGTDTDSSEVRAGAGGGAEGGGGREYSGDK